MGNGGKLGLHGIRVNSVTPGMIKTDMSKHAWSNPEISGRITDQLPLRRRGEPIDMAGAVVFLASEEASFINGTESVVDGGWLVR